MKTYKIFLLADNNIQIYGITVRCQEIKFDDNNFSACYIDHVYIDFDMKIDRIEEVK